MAEITDVEIVSFVMYQLLLQTSSTFGFTTNRVEPRLLHFCVLSSLLTPQYTQRLKLGLSSRSD